jgi:hypothetical protein
MLRLHLFEWIHDWLTDTVYSVKHSVGSVGSYMCWWEVSSHTEKRELLK